MVSHQLETLGEPKSKEILAYVIYALKTKPCLTQLQQCLERFYG